MKKYVFKNLVCYVLLSIIIVYTHPLVFAQESWFLTSNTNVPSPREYHTAVWTGTWMVIWGGYTSGPLNTGGIYSSSSIGIKNTHTKISAIFSLSQNYPNPFNPSTKIKFSIPLLSLMKGVGLTAEASAQAGGIDVSLKIYDILGREVSTLVNQKIAPGTYEVDFNASNYSGGVYFYKLIAGNFVETKKMILIK